MYVEPRPFGCRFSVLPNKEDPDGRTKVNFEGTGPQYGSGDSLDAC
jgi:hypothetical protein